MLAGVIGTGPSAYPSPDAHNSLLVCDGVCLFVCVCICLCVSVCVCVDVCGSIKVPLSRQSTQ